MEKNLIQRVPILAALLFYVLLLVNLAGRPVIASPVRETNVQRISQNATVEFQPGNFNASSLQKRGPCLSSLCCLGSTSTPPGQQWVCQKQWPTLADLRLKIAEQGNVGNKISLFYSGLTNAPGDAPGGSQSLAAAWACSHTDYIPPAPGYVTFDGIVDNAWYDAQGEALQEVYGTIDPFQKLLSQAFAEQSAGDVYLFTPYGVDPLTVIPNAYTTIAWAGWEYPALTRNPAVTAIWRVDPRSSALDNDRHLLWAPTNGPSPQPPLGLYNAPQPLNSQT